MQQKKQKIVLITGGARGCGAAISKHLAHLGYPVLIQYQTSQGAALELCQQFPYCQSIQGDFSSLQGIESFCAQIAQFDIAYLINNAGPCLVKPLLHTTPEDWRSLYFSNFLIAVELIRVLQPSICLHQGAIVNVGLAGLSMANSGFPAYHSLKSALWSYTRSLALEMAASGVNVNMVSPGYIEGSAMVPQGKLPMGRGAAMSEIIDAVCFCLNNKYLTGQNIEVAGAFRL